MQERKHTLSTSHHVKTLKQQQYDRNLIDFVIELVRINDHDTLAYIARTSGIPPQLRHIVWPILLKYHPMCIAPNILSNIVSWDPTMNTHHMIIEPSTNRSKRENSDKRSINNNGKESQDVNSTTTTTTTSTTTNNNNNTNLKYYKKNKNESANTNDSNNDSEFDKYNELDNDNEIDNDDIALEKAIVHDLQKYFKIRTKIKNSATTTTTTTPNNNSSNNTNIDTSLHSSRTCSHNDSDLLTTANELKIIDALKDAILKFTKKWSKVYKYESGLSWIALGLAEWFPVLQSSDSNDEYSHNNKCNGPVILSGKKHVHGPSQPSVPITTNNSKVTNEAIINVLDRPDNDMAALSSVSSTTKPTTAPTNCHKQSTSLTFLYSEYPLPESLQDQLPGEYIFNFVDMYERLLLVILHSPDSEISTENINKDFPSKSSYLSNYFPILSGGDLSFQFQLFFKVFSSILPELFQPLNDESSLQPNSVRSSWLYWWIKCAGARSLQRQDRGRIWDLLLGWRPKPNMDAMNFFLNYNNHKVFSQLYHCPPPGLNENFLRSKSIDITFVKKLLKSDTFWFPDLDNIPLGSEKFPYDFNVFKELLTRNKYEQISKEPPTNDDFMTPVSATVDSTDLQQDLLKSVASSLSNYSLQDQKDGSVDSTNSNGYDNLAMFEYSQVHPHIQVIFIYIAVLQYNEFKLLEFEETEILEFLNNLPMFSKSEDSNFRNLYLGTDNIPSDNSHQHVINSGRKSTMISRADDSSKRYTSGELSTGLTTRSSSSSLSSVSNTSTTNTTGSIVYNQTVNQNSHMMIEVGNDAKASNSFNDLLTIAGDIWRKWLWKELEESVINDLE